MLSIEIQGKKRDCQWSRINKILYSVSKFIWTSKSGMVDYIWLVITLSEIKSK